jgi:hypothetical protein
VRTHYVGAGGNTSLECSLEVGVPSRKGSVTRGKGLCVVHNIHLRFLKSFLTSVHRAFASLCGVLPKTLLFEPGRRDLYHYRS